MAKASSLIPHEGTYAMPRHRSIDEQRSLALQVINQPIESVSILTAAANILLPSSELLAQLEDADRETLARRLFPYFNLPTGWLEVARKGKLVNVVIATLIMNRVNKIDSLEKGQQETPFLTTLLERPGKPSRGYRQVLSHDQRLQVAKIARSYAPEVYECTRVDTIAWRHGL